MRRRHAIVLGLTLLAASVGAQPRTPTPAPLFRFDAGDFWLNLHHFLYVLGRAEANAPDASREAVATAPAEAARMLGTLTPDERRVWQQAVKDYAETLSTLSLLQMPMPVIAITLNDAKDAPSLAGIQIDQAARTVIESAAPIYRKTLWEAHRTQHQRFQADLQRLLDRHGQAVHDFLTSRYGIAWPAGGYPVHFVAYASAQGNYSLTTRDGVGFLVMSTNPNAANAGLLPLETVFHEGMHQWDRQISEALRTAAGNAAVPQDLTHAMIFFTSGEAVHRIDPAHVPYIDRFGLWKGRLSGSPLAAERLRAPLQEIWQPYLDGRGTREAALAALVTRVLADQQRAPATAPR
jgi:hypothetical protein